MIPIHFTARSSNRKLGPIPATTLGRQGCPDSCAFYDAGCYGDDYYTRMHWDRVTSGERDHGIENVSARIRKLDDDQVWRHAVTGDVASTEGQVDADLVDRLAWANDRRPVIAFSHADMALGNNLQIFRDAAARGFNFNLSANSPAHADKLAQYGLPVVTVLPADAPKALTTPGGLEVRTCPATYKEDKTCSNCGLCARPNRGVLVGFPAHGTGWKKVDLVARGKA